MKEYLTDEELNLLIEQLERQELYAPKHMKEQILRQAFPAKAVVRQTQTFSYRLKIIAGMAAALLMLAILPMQGQIREYPAAETESWLEDAEKAESDEGNGPDWNGALNRGMRRTGERLNAWIGRIDHLQLDVFMHP